MQRLPEEILTQVFTNLSSTDLVSLSLVCKSWTTIVTRMIWRHPTWTMQNVERVSPAAIQRLHTLIQSFSIELLPSPRDTVIGRSGRWVQQLVAFSALLSPLERSERSFQQINLHLYYVGVNELWSQTYHPLNIPLAQVLKNVAALTPCINLTYDGDTARATHFNCLIDLIEPRVKSLTLIDDPYESPPHTDDYEEIVLDTCVPVTDYVDISGYRMTELAYRAFDYLTYAEYEEGEGFSSRQRAKTIGIKAQDETVARKLLSGTGIKLVVKEPPKPYTNMKQTQ